MAAMGDSSQVTQNFSNPSVNDTSNKNLLENSVDDNNIEYGLPLFEVYKLALSFYKEKEGKAVHFSYEDKLQLVAFSQQVLHGPLSEAVHKLPPLGTLDVVGKDRRLAWQKLGNLPADQARAGFVELLSRRCPLFSTYIEAHRREKKEQERLNLEAQKLKLIEEEEKFKKEAEEKLVREQLEKEESVKRQIQQALNEQTYGQFRKYAEQQYPGDPEKQGALVRQLQEQHYIQYMQQLQASQQGERLNTKQNDEDSASIEETKTAKSDISEDTNSPSSIEESHMLVPASMWTRSDIEKFKQVVSQAEGDGVVRVEHGETVTVRVPTHQEGSKLFWEFATDHYDIGFGVYFEFGTPSSDQVSVHVSESEDEDGEDDLEDDSYEDETIHAPDLESGALTVNGLSKPLLTEIVPVYRRDCQNEVYAGSHRYPGQGVYLLKFDNSYSLWRSKTLYYRVYYTQ